MFQTIRVILIVGVAAYVRAAIRPHLSVIRIRLDTIFSSLGSEYEFYVTVYRRDNKSKFRHGSLMWSAGGTLGNVCSYHIHTYEYTVSTGFLSHVAELGGRAN